MADARVGYSKKPDGSFRSKTPKEAQAGKLKRLEVYKAANAADAAYYRRIIKDTPERVVDLLLMRDMDQHEAGMRSIVRQLPDARRFYSAQPDQVKRRIDQRTAAVHPYYADQTFVTEVAREQGRQERLQAGSAPRIS